MAHTRIGDDVRQSTRRRHSTTPRSIAVRRARSAPSDHHRNHLGWSTTIMLLPMRLFLAAGWLRAGSEKLMDGEWWSGAGLRNYLAGQHDEALPFFRPVMDHLIAPAAVMVALVVMVTQLMCGLAIGSGRRMRLALRWGFMLNIVFLLAGSVNPSAFYLVMELVMLFAIADGALGVEISTPSRRTIVTAAVSAALAVACVPYIRTIEPERVTDDPAMMLSFIGAVVAVTLVARWAAHPTRRQARLGGTRTRYLAAWIHAQPHATLPRSTTLVRQRPLTLIGVGASISGWPPPLPRELSDVAHA